MSTAARHLDTYWGRWHCAVTFFTTRAIGRLHPSWRVTMRFACLPGPYVGTWALFLFGAGLRFLQEGDPERFGQYGEVVITDLGQRLTTICGIAVFFSTLWLAHTSWERAIRRKRKRPLVELTQVEQFYGGAVFVRRIPRRVWDVADDGDRLIKPKWSLFVRHVPRG